MSPRELNLLGVELCSLAASLRAEARDGLGRRGYLGTAARVLETRGLALLRAFPEPAGGWGQAEPPTA